MDEYLHKETKKLNPMTIDQGLKRSSTNQVHTIIRKIKFTDYFRLARFFTSRLLWLLLRGVPLQSENRSRSEK
jgi:hypothetical protein